MKFAAHEIALCLSIASSIRQMWSLLFCVIGSCGFVVIEGSMAFAQSLASGAYQASIDTPGGEVRFLVRIQEENGIFTALIGNGEGQWKISQVQWEVPWIRLVIPEYDARIDAQLFDGGVFRGTYRRTRGKGLVAELPFRMLPYKESVNSVGDAQGFLGRWKLQFSDSDAPAVAVIRGREGRVVGTVLTTTGDYRYLDGEVDAQSGELHLSAFDGGHVFLIKGQLDTKGSLAGKFWSGDWYQVDWKAWRDSDAKLPTGFGMARVRDSLSLGDLEFPDIDGERHKLDNPDFLGEVTIVELFGSWCPNCHDAAAMLGDFHRQFRDRGLKIIGLAFELTGDPSRDREQVRRYIERYEIEYPVLIAGVSDKALASEAFPLLDRIRAYPSFLFVDRHGQVVETYSGFSGPATGDEHQQLRKQFIDKIEQLFQP